MDGKIQEGHQEKIEINQLVIPIILTDETGVVCHMNPCAEKLAVGQKLIGSKIGQFIDIRRTRCLIGGETYNVTVSPYEQNGFKGSIYVLVSIEDVLREESEHRVRETSDMVAEIAHEIRNPLGSIELLASLLRKSAAGERDIRRFEQIILSVKAINERISELLRLSKRRALRKQLFCINRLLQDIFRIPDQMEAFFVVHLADEEMSVKGDEKMLRQMFLNLLIQILQIMPAAARLYVETKRHQEDSRVFVEVTFRCEGEGSLFQQFDLTLGLNLAIIHNLIQMHHGIVNIGSSALSILLPAAKP